MKHWVRICFEVEEEVMDREDLDIVIADLVAGRNDFINISVDIEEKKE